jgi:hypothetical protein
MHGHNKPPLLSFGARLALSMRHNTPISPKTTGYFSDLEAVKKTKRYIYIKMQILASPV